MTENLGMTVHNSHPARLQPSDIHRTSIRRPTPLRDHRRSLGTHSVPTDSVVRATPPNVTFTRRVGTRQRCSRHQFGDRYAFERNLGPVGPRDKDASAPRAYPFDRNAALTCPHETEGSSTAVVECVCTFGLDIGLASAHEMCASAATVQDGCAHHWPGSARPHAPGASPLMVRGGCAGEHESRGQCFRSSWGRRRSWFEGCGVHTKAGTGARTEMCASALTVWEWLCECARE